MGWIFLLIVFALGASIGSFLNVVIYRVPLGLSIVKPGSRCPHCETPLRARHNVPIFSWLALGGRCSFCGVGISARYPLVELAMGLLTVAWFADLAGGVPTRGLFADPGFGYHVIVPFVLYGAFMAVMVANILIDLDWFILPDGLTLPMMPLGLASAFAAGDAIGVTWQQSLWGAAVGAGVLLSVLLVYGALTGRAGLGGGDWKLLGAIGAWLGLEAVPIVIFVASIEGLVFALLFRRNFATAVIPPDPRDSPRQSGDPGGSVGGSVGGSGAPRSDSEPSIALAAPVSFRHLVVPFGPFLALAAIQYLLLRQPIIDFITSVGQAAR